jgi:hypothetical protein
LCETDGGDQRTANANEYVQNPEHNDAIAARREQKSHEKPPQWGIERER